MSPASLTVSAILAPPAWAGTLGATGFDWSSAGISAAAVAGLVIGGMAVVSGVRHARTRKD